MANQQYDRKPVKHSKSDYLINSEKGLTSSQSRGNITSDQPTMNLDNGMSALPPVQANREFTTPNGCHVRLFFKEEHDPRIRKEIARLLLTAFENERTVDDETSHVSVQSIDEGPG